MMGDQLLRHGVTFIPQELLRDRRQPQPPTQPPELCQPGHGCQHSLAHCTAPVLRDTSGSASLRQTEGSGSDSQATSQPAPGELKHGSGPRLFVECWCQKEASGLAARERDAECDSPGSLPLLLGW